MVSPTPINPPLRDERGRFIDTPANSFDPVVALRELLREVPQLKGDDDGE